MRITMIAAARSLCEIIWYCKLFRIKRGRGEGSLLIYDTGNRIKSLAPSKDVAKGEVAVLIKLRVEREIKIPHPSDPFGRPLALQTNWREDPWGHSWWSVCAYDLLDGV